MSSNSPRVDQSVNVVPAASMPLAPEPTANREVTRFQQDQGVASHGDVISEVRFSIFLNERELVSLMCSPVQLRELVAGFLFAEGFINDLGDIELMRVCPEDRLAEVVIRNGEAVDTSRRILTSGCTGGQTFGRYLEEVERFRVDAGSTVRPATLYALIRRLYESASLYRRSGGVHTSILADGSEILEVAEDIGRHNTLDKLQGAALLRGIETRGRMILTTGRISSEMLIKSAIMGVSIVASRTSPTELAVILADRLNITLVGYLRSSSLSCYANDWRLRVETEPP